MDWQKPSGPACARLCAWRCCPRWDAALRLADGQRRSAQNPRACLFRGGGIRRLAAAAAVSHAARLHRIDAGFAGVLRHVLELHRLRRPLAAGAACGRGRGLGACALPLPFQEGRLCAVRLPHAHALPGDYDRTVPVAGCPAPDGHALGNHPAAAFSTLPVFIMARFFEAVPGSVLEAARIDGAGEARIFLCIALPLGFPGLLSAMVLSFIEIWGMIEQPMTFLRSQNLWPLSMYLPQITQDSLGWAMTASAIALMPPLLVFLCGQRNLVQGIGRWTEGRMIECRSKGSGAPYGRACWGTSSQPCCF